MVGLTAQSVLMLIAFLLAIAYVSYDTYNDKKMDTIEKIFWIIMAFLLSYIGLVTYLIMVKGLDRRILKKSDEPE
ncbi:MAG: hypothetical protein GWN01_00770 [Nitrosopumilaceae archaeon]|nr:hypothetical protein [Nitrosopumilaceae archaeon]NIU85883.1 hypothetical protein [Nitrosopumilaceae archaeon]NIX60116.1 hypothetical protein [Nitrosopumilaceae archaeon]